MKGQRSKKCLFVCACFVLFIVVLLMNGCTIGGTLYSSKIPFITGDKLYITTGDDPGSESLKPYEPKGMLLHVERAKSTCFFNLCIDDEDANPERVMEEIILPKVRNMGGDALINAYVDYTPDDRYCSCIGPNKETIIVKGTVVKRK